MIYTNATMSGGEHGLFQSSLLESTLSGHLWDCKVCSVDTSGATPVYTPIDVDNGTAVCVLTETGNGLQERYAKIAGVKDKVGIVGTPAIVKDAFTRAQADETNFYNKAGNLSKVYEVRGDAYDYDIFGVGKHQFTQASQANITLGAYVILDGNGKYVAQAAAPTASSYGFIGKVHSIQEGLYYTVVRIAVIQNVDNN